MRRALGFSISRVTTGIALSAIAFGCTLTAYAGGGEDPTVTVIYPNGGESLLSASTQEILWTASDPHGVAYVDIYVSFDNAATWQPIALNYYNGGNISWVVPNRPTTQALIRVDAIDFANSIGSDVSDSDFTVVNSTSGRLPTTLRDFDFPGSQPLDPLQMNDPSFCQTCHADYNYSVEPFHNWKGSMMAYASYDPAMKAAMHIANQDAPEAGDTCIRCHSGNGWLAGRSQPTDASGLYPDVDMVGVNCALCHQMLNPHYQEGVSPIEDEDILNGIASVPTTFGNAQYVIDPASTRYRGPFTDTVCAHTFIPSPFHRDAALCGTCHDVSNPVLSRDPDTGEVTVNAFDEAAPSVGPGHLFAEQRTYSEWFFSAFNTPGGVHAPEFGGNHPNVSTCQDCHMRDVTGRACFFPFAPTRNDLPLHDLSGGSTWMLSIMPQVLGPENPYADTYAIADGIVRARYMLQNAADLAGQRQGELLNVTVTNRTGHKLPTGYPEGRRVWVNVKFYNAANALIAESGSYDPVSADLSTDPNLKVYEIRMNAREDVAEMAGVPEGTEFHLILNSEVEKDNRIPPLGFSLADYQEFGGAPVGATYADGQNWDATLYPIPDGAVRATVNLYYQSFAKDYVEFLRDNGGPDGATFYDLWDNNDRCPPELMASVEVPLLIGDMNCDGATNAFDIDPFVYALTDPAAYNSLFPDCDWHLGDTNGDGVVNNFDIDPFVAILEG